MITFIAVMVSINFVLLCLNEYGSLKRMEALGKMQVIQADALDRMEERLK